MRSLRWVALVAIVGFIVWNQYLRPSGPPVGGVAPDFEATTLDDDPFVLSEHAGRVVVLDFWATWCPPCQRSLPALQAVHERLARDPDVVVASVNTDPPKLREDKVRRFMKDRRYTFPVIFDDPSVSLQSRYGIQSIPTVVVIAPDGKVHHVQVGLPSPDVTKIAEHLESLIDEVRPPS